MNNISYTNPPENINEFLSRFIFLIILCVKLYNLSFISLKERLFNNILLSFNVIKFSKLFNNILSFLILSNSLIIKFFFLLLWFHKFGLNYF